MQLGPDLPVGVPSFDLSEDEVETVIALTCRGAREARANVTPGMLEVPISIRVRKAMRQVKKQLGLTNLEVRGEHELEDMSTNDSSLLGRIDITLKFRRQFGDEDDYIAIECKRVGAGGAYSVLNGRYVSEGVARFVNGQYAVGHAWGFMLGYVLSLPVDQVIDTIGTRLCKDYGKDAKLTPRTCHQDALTVKVGRLVQQSGHTIRLCHLFVDMTPAA
ncbi:hypothetical protein [Myxococcus sp. Y35]|uniref:hypothetical protein n=1 Tax=Pseudomyxococcus flavus TaxID=3115648 RepID=UPI003CFB8E77